MLRPAPVKPTPLGNGASEGSSSTSWAVAFTIMLARTVGDKIMKTAVPWAPYGQPRARCHNAPHTQEMQSCSSQLKAPQKYPSIDQP